MKKCSCVYTVIFFSEIPVADIDIAVENVSNFQTSSKSNIEHLVVVIFPFFLIFFFFSFQN